MHWRDMFIVMFPCVCVFVCVIFQPANILLDENGHVRISDLGLACDFSKKKPHASVWVSAYLSATEKAVRQGGGGFGPYITRLVGPKTVWESGSDSRLKATPSRISHLQGRCKFSNFPDMLPTRVVGHSSRYFSPRTWRHTDKIICQSATTSVTSSAGVRSPWAHSKSSDVMEWARDALKAVYMYKSVVLAKLLYAAPAWWGSIQTRLTKTGSKRLCDAELNSVSIKTLIPLHHNSLKISTTNYSEQFCTIPSMSSITCCQTELIKIGRASCRERV